MAWLAGFVAAAAAPTEATALPPLPDRVRGIIESRCQECRETYGDNGVLDLDHLRREPLVFLCSDGAGCEECDRARASIRAPETPDS